MHCNQFKFFIGSFLNKHTLLISTVNNRICNYTNSIVMWKRLRVCVCICICLCRAVLAEHCISISNAGKTIVKSLIIVPWCERLCDAVQLKWKKERKIQIDRFTVNEWMKIPSPQKTKISHKHFIETAIHPYMHHSIWRKRLFNVFRVMWSVLFHYVLWRSVHTSFSTPPPPRHRRCSRHCLLHLKVPRVGEVIDLQIGKRQKQYQMIL